MLMDGSGPGGTTPPSVGIGVPALDDACRDADRRCARGHVDEHEAHRADAGAAADAHSAEDLAVGPHVDIVLQDGERSAFDLAADRRPLPKRAVRTEARAVVHDDVAEVV